MRIIPKYIRAYIIIDIFQYTKTIKANFKQQWILITKSFLLAHLLLWSLHLLLQIANSSVKFFLFVLLLSLSHLIFSIKNRIGWSCSLCWIEFWPVFHPFHLSLDKLRTIDRITCLRSRNRSPFVFLICLDMISSSLLVAESFWPDQNIFLIGTFKTTNDLNSQSFIAIVRDQLQINR